MGNKKTHVYRKKRKFPGNQYETKAKKAKVRDQNETTKESTSLLLKKYLERFRLYAQKRKTRMFLAFV